MIAKDTLHLVIGKTISHFKITGRLGAGGMAKGESVSVAQSPTTGAISVAVLPFQNLGADASTDYLRLAVPDEITNVLARVPSLAVRPFASSASLGDSGLDPATAGKELGASNLVTGQYFAAGDELQLTLEAINAEENRLGLARKLGGAGRGSSEAP